MAMNATEFFEALELLETERGISKEVVIQALKEAMIRGYKKQLGGDDADVRCDIDLEKGTIDLYEVKIVRDEVQDDFLEISTEEANRLRPNMHYKDGDEFIIPAPIEEIRKATAMKIKSVLKQKFSETEKTMLYEAYKDKIGTIITGRVERVEDRGVSVNIGKASVYLPRKEMIGNETFNVGDSIKVYISEVAGDSKGAKIVITRRSEDFLRCLFSDADGIHDIYDGTIIIKAIARRAGERSKVAVFSNDPNVDPAAACIGPNGTKIQKIVSQLGNGTIKEKIDIITYSDITALYLMESIKPAKALGVEIDEDNKEALIVVADDALKVAVGRNGINASLASKLTGYKISVAPETEAIEDQVDYISYDEAQKEAMDILNKAREEKERESEAESSLPGLPEGYVAPQERVYEDESSELDEALEESVEKEENEQASSKEEPAEEAKEEPKEEEVKEEPKEENKTTKVKTTTTIEDLEKSIEEDKSKKTTQKKKNTRKKKDEDEEETDNTESTVKKSDPSTHMAIYTEEELREIEEEEAKGDDYDDEDIDYDEYDEYYEDDDR
ncbi:MAG: transcription termination factor NusA [Bacilli bacterium]|nr:transcription termination factor NusA [Bacilli bacterium]